MFHDWQSCLLPLRCNGLRRLWIHERYKRGVRIGRAWVRDAWARADA